MLYGLDPDFFLNLSLKSINHKSLTAVSMGCIFALLRLEATTSLIRELIIVIFGTF